MTAIPVLFSLTPHPLQTSLCQQLPASEGKFTWHHFPDGESYVRINTSVPGCHCIVLADLSSPDEKYLPLIYLAETLRELGALSIGLVAPYLSYMRQDRRFQAGEAISSRIFASQLSQHFDWLVTVDPHLHRYDDLNAIYSIPTVVTHAAPLLAGWLQTQSQILLLGPDAESLQWVKEVARLSHHPYVIASKQRLGDRDVIISLPDISQYKSRTVVIIDDVIASGQTLVACINALHKQGVRRIYCAAIHGIFADGIAEVLLAQGVERLVTSNAIVHDSNVFDLTGLLLESIKKCLPK